jgi:hypothetical protein
MAFLFGSEDKISSLRMVWTFLERLFFNGRFLLVVELDYIPDSEVLFQPFLDPSSWSSGVAGIPPPPPPPPSIVPPPLARVWGQRTRR